MIFIGEVVAINVDPEASRWSSTGGYAELKQVKRARSPIGRAPQPLLTVPDGLP